MRELKSQVAFLLRKNDNDDKLISALKVLVTPSPCLFLAAPLCSLCPGPVVQQAVKARTKSMPLRLCADLPGPATPFAWPWSEALEVSKRLTGDLIISCRPKPHRRFTAENRGCTTGSMSSVFQAFESDHPQAGYQAPCCLPAWLRC